MYIMIFVHIVYISFLSLLEICLFFYLTRLPLHNTVNALLLGIYGRTAVFQFSEFARCARKNNKPNLHVIFTLFRSYIFRFYFKVKTNVFDWVLACSLIRVHSGLMIERFQIFYSMIRNSSNLYCNHRSLWLIAPAWKWIMGSISSGTWESCHIASEWMRTESLFLK